MAERIQTQGFVLLRKSFGENDLVLTMMTHACGVVSAFAKSAKKSKKRFPHRFSPCHYYDVTLVRQSGDMFRVSRCDAKKSFFHLSNSLEKIAFLSYFLEVVASGAPKEQTNRPLFHFLIDLYLFLENHDLEKAFDWGLVSLFEARLLKVLGFEPQLRRCMICHRPFHAKGSGSSDLLFSYPLGGAIHRECEETEGWTADKSTDRMPISLQTVQVLSQGLGFEDKEWRTFSALPAGDNQGLGAIRFSSRSRREARKILPDFLEYQLGKPIKSRKFLSEVLC